MTTSKHTPKSVSAVDFYFDPMCPWAHQTSLWIRNVRSQNGIAINWKFFSLEETNRVEGKKHPWEREVSFGWTPMRIGAWMRRIDMDLCDKWYEAIGNALHIQGRRPYEEETALQLLAAIGAPLNAWTDALADASTHDDVRNDHEFAVKELGGFGVPILKFATGRAVFGPVVVPAPEGSDAIELWDLTVSYAHFPGLFEIKTPKTQADLEHIGNVFNPYLKAREWKTVQNPAL